LCDVLSEFSSHSKQLLTRHDFRDQTSRKRFFSVHHPRRERPFKRNAVAHQQRQPLQRPNISHDSQVDFLDAKLRVQMRAEISSLHNRLKATMIYVTHDQVEALTMADVIVVMKFGLIQQIGGPLPLYNDPQNKFVAGFIGSPPMNFLETAIEADGDDLYANEGTFRLKLTAEQKKMLTPYVGKSVTFGIRPEDVKFIHAEKDGETINGRVSVVEPLGSETHVYIATSKSQVIGKIDPTVIPKVDSKIYLIPDMAKVKFFDIDTEQIIKPVK
jgi:multiple sugar transport system ATP-binding protein